MTPEQARRIVRNQFKLLDLSKIVMQRSDDALSNAIVKAAELISTLPPAGDIFREQAWKTMLPTLNALFRSATDGLARELVPVLVDDVRAQTEFAASYMNGGKLPQMYWSEKSSLNGVSLAGQPAGLQLNAPGFALGSSTSTPPWAFEASIGNATFTVKVPREIYATVQKLEIGKSNLQRVFGAAIDDAGRLTIGQEASGLSRFLVSEVDKRVRAGFLAGQATDEIAKLLVVDSVRGGYSLGPTAMQLKQSAAAVTRTALLDLANRVHEQVWDANERDGDGNKQIVFYIFDATNDARACPTCSALDGKEGPKDAIPRPPLHPQCRCQKLPVSRTELELRKSGDGLKDTPGSAVELVSPGDMPSKQRSGETQREYLQRIRQESPEGVRWYAQPQNVNGQKFYVRARDLKKPGTVVDWLADKDTSRAALEQSMGGGQAGARRAQWFLNQVGKDRDPQKVYADMLRFRGMTNRTVQPDRLAKFKPLKDLPGANAIQVKPRRPISRQARPPR